MDHPANSINTSSSLLRGKLEAHVAAWKDCDKCGLCKTAHWRVIGSGSLPCDILFIGEAPGNDENALGKPFLGAAGQLMKRMIASAIRQLWRTHKIKWDFTSAMTNVVACIPTDGKANTNGYVFREPNATEAHACSPRLAHFIQLASPKGIVVLGKRAAVLGMQTIKPTIAASFPKERVPPIHETYHPSYILRVRNGLLSKEATSWQRHLTSFLKTVYEKNRG